MVPGALLGMVGLLVLATALEQRRVKACVRMAVKAGTSPEATEAVVAAEVAPLLAAEGLLSRRRSVPT